MGNRQNQFIIVGLSIIAIVSFIGAGFIIFSEQENSSSTAVSLSPTTPTQETISTETAASATPTTPPLKNITLQIDNENQSFTTTAATVAQLFTNENILLGKDDRVVPSLDTALQNGTKIQIFRAIPVTIEVDGRTYPIQTTYQHVSDVLVDAGIGLVGLDDTIPDKNAPIQANDTIQVIRVTEDFWFEDTILPYDTIYQADPELEIDNRALISSGSPGILRQQIRTRYENGVAITETIDSEWIAQPVVNEVIGYGTNIVIRTINTPEGPLEYWRVVRMKVTGYTAATSGKSRDDPGYGITASGLQAGKGVVAIDPKVVPFRSNIYVEGYGKAVAGDTGGLVKGRIIDLGFDEGAYETWRGQVDVYYLTPLPAPEKINYLIPTTIP